MEGNGSAGTFEDLVNAAAEHEKPWDSRHDRGEPVGSAGSSSTSYVSMVALLLLPQITRRLGPRQHTPPLPLCNPSSRTGQAYRSGNCDEPPRAHAPTMQRLWRKEVR
jgi:hypothetical protein